MQAGQRFDEVGTIANRQVFNGGKSVKATMHTESAGSPTVVWWAGGLAPQNGERVRVEGTVRDSKYSGGLEVDARQTFVDWKRPPKDELARLAGFFRDCVEAEAAEALHFEPGSPGHIEITRGTSPFHGPIAVPNDPHTIAWCVQRASAIGETLIAGWPLIVGRTQQGGRGASPLLVTEVRLQEDRDQWRCERIADYVELNSYALELLGYDRDGQQALAKAVDDSPQVDAASEAGARATAILQVLTDGGVDGLTSLDPGALCPPKPKQEGVWNAGVVRETFGRGSFTRKLADDLDELIHRPHLMRRGPAAVLLRHASVATVPPPEPHPTLVASSIEQDRAVHAAMTNEFTVVTGPPGTGKSQVLVNVVAAALERGETVLLASKNNKAVDVVVERLRKDSPHGIVVRTGNRAHQQSAATEIRNWWTSPPRSVDGAQARSSWQSAAGDVGHVHQVLHDRDAVERLIKVLDAQLAAFEITLPDILIQSAQAAGIDPAQLLESARDSALLALDAFGRGLGLFRRYSKHAARLAGARAELKRLDDLIDLGQPLIQEILQPVTGRPRPSFAPRQAFAPVEQRIESLIGILRCRDQRSKAGDDLSLLPSQHELEDRLAALTGRRTGAGKSLVNACWAAIRADPQAQVDAIQAATNIENGRWIEPKALRALPVLALTNLSARPNLPLQPGLFDLVVIDEASQCDAASALPLLVRAKRAMIIGDPNQLTHITTLSATRENLIGSRWGLEDGQAPAFSYRSESCYGLAESAEGASPIFLDLHFRSHPAIIGFANLTFYDGRMKLCGDRKPPDGMRAIEWDNVQGKCEPRNRSRINRREASAVVDRIAREFDAVREKEFSIGVVTPYSAQAELIRDLLSRSIGSDQAAKMTIATAHLFQGDECDVMYFSPVVDRSMTDGQVRFAADRNLINVALTRARRRMVIVGDIHACQVNDTALRELARYVGRMEEGGFESPLQMEVVEALRQRGIRAKVGVEAAGHRLDISVEGGEFRLDIECDGAAFPRNSEVKSHRDRAVEAAGWTVMRLSARELSRDLDGASERIRRALN